MEEVDWMGWLEQISILIGIWVLIYGIDSWRREHVGKRKMELAEDTLALFYEAQDVIKFIRHPVSYVHETEEVERGQYENDSEFSARKNASVVFYRYNERQELFNKIHASRYRFMALVGKEESRPFDELRNVVNGIVSSARMLSRLWARADFVSDEQWEQHRKRVEKHEAVFWDSFEEEDEINQKLHSIVSDMEKTCHSIIEGRGTIFGWLNKKIGK